MRNLQSSSNSPNSSSTLTDVSSSGSNGPHGFTLEDFNNLPEEVLVFNGTLLGPYKSGFDQILDFVVRIAFTESSDDTIGDFAAQLMSLKEEHVPLVKFLEITQDLSKVFPHLASVEENQLDKLVLNYFAHFSVFKTIFEVQNCGNGSVLLKKKSDFSEAKAILESFGDSNGTQKADDEQLAATARTTYAKVAANVSSPAIDNVNHVSTSASTGKIGQVHKKIGNNKDVRDEGDEEYLFPKKHAKATPVPAPSKHENTDSNFYSGLKDTDDDDDEDDEIQVLSQPHQDKLEEGMIDSGANHPIQPSKMKMNLMESQHHQRKSAPTAPMKPNLEDSQISYASSDGYDSKVLEEAQAENHRDRFIGVGNLRHEYSWDTDDDQDLSFLTQRSNENDILSRLPGMTATAQDAETSELSATLVQYNAQLQKKIRKLKKTDGSILKNLKLLKDAEESYRKHDKSVRKDHDDRYQCHKKEISTQWFEIMSTNQSILDGMQQERSMNQSILDGMKQERIKMQNIGNLTKKHLADVQDIKVECSEMKTLCAELLQDTIQNRKQAETANHLTAESKEHMDTFHMEFRKDLQQATMIQHQLQQTKRLKRFDDLEANFHDALERLHALESSQPTVVTGTSTSSAIHMEASSNSNSSAPASQEVSNDSSTQHPSANVDPSTTNTTVPDVSRTTIGEDMTFAQAFQPVEGTRTLEGTFIRHAHVHNDPTQIVSIFDMGDSQYKAIWQNSRRELFIAELEQYIWVETAAGFQWHNVLYPIFNEDSVEYEAETLISPRETRLIRGSNVKRIQTVPKVGQYVLTHGTQWNKVITQKLSSSELCLQVQSLLDPLIISDININQVKKIADRPPQFAHVDLTPTSTPTRSSHGPPGGCAGNVFRSIPNVNANDRSVPIQNQHNSTSTEENQQGNTEYQNGHTPQQNFQQSQFHHNSPFGQQQHSPFHGSTYGTTYRHYTPNLDAYQFIYPWDPQNPQSQTTSYFKIKDFKKDKVLSKCNQLELENGKATNFTDWYDDFVWVCNDLHILLKRTDEIKVLESVNDLLVPNENNCLNFNAMKKEASRVLYDLFHTTGEHLLQADRRSLSNLPTYKRRRDGLEFLFKVVTKHHPSYNTSRCRKIQFGPKFQPAEHSIFQFAHQLMDWKHEQAQPFTPLELSKYFIEQMDSRFEIGKGLVLLDIQNLEDKYGREVDLVNHLHLSLPNIVDHLLQRTTTDSEKQNLYSGTLESPTIPSVNKTDFSRGREQSRERDSRYRSRSTERSRPQDRRYNSRSTSRDSYNSKPRAASKSIPQQEPSLCPICKQSARRCKDGCINVGISLSVQDYLQKYPHRDRTKLLRDYEESQETFIKKMKDNYYKRQKARIKKVQLVEKLQNNPALTADQITSMTESFVRTKEAEDPDLFYGAFDRSLEDDQEPMLA
ncbi:predicted protein [Chaetoceros tenuissimus]|uniref:Uncharacterized protein n=1 Tax=Chaetoceros tenuissimus TaxID=426638 RepID=A0AAD3D814_9STRA|nr:predicted protein [Chaetoceros tenuissimus]